MLNKRSFLFAAVAIVTLPFAYFACVGDTPVGPNDSGPDSSPTGDANAPDVPSVGCPLGCLPPAPSGWTGPSAVYDGPASSKPAACPTNYTQKEVDAFQGLDASAAVCNCGAPTNQGASCTATVSAWSGAGCTGSASLQGSFSTPGACLQLGNSGYVKVSTPTLSEGTCSYPAQTTTLPDASVAKSDISCGLPQNAACAGSPSCVATPLPDAPFTRLCVHEDGDVPCPNADYAQRFVAYKTVTDTRTCSPCTGTATGGSCGNTWGIGSTASTCMNTPPSQFAVNSCGSTLYGVGAYIGGAIGPSNVGCTPDGGTADGGVAAGDPVTFCCNK